MAIMDKCVLNDFIDDINYKIELTQDKIKIINELRKEAALLIPTQKEKNSSSYFGKFYSNFSSNRGLDTSSNCYIDYNLGICTTKILGINDIKYDLKIDDNVYTSIPDFGISLDKKDISLKISFLSSIVKNIKLELLSSNEYSYKIINKKEILASGKGYGSLDVAVKRDTYESLTVEISFLKIEKCIIKNISVSDIGKDSFGEIITKPIKLYDTGVINFEATGHDIKKIIGINKNNSVYYFDGDSPLVIAKDNIYSKNIINISSNRVFEEVQDPVIYRGYNRYHLALIKGAFVNEDLSAINFKDEDVLRTEYADIDNLILDINEGELFVLSQTVYVENDIDIDEPIPEFSDDIRWSITINGKRCNNSSGRIKNTLNAGENIIKINIYKWINKASKLKTPTKTLVKFNLREYSSLVYDFKMKLATIEYVLKDKTDETFYINKGIYVKRATKDDSFLIKYTKPFESPYYCEDKNGKYIECILKVILNSEKSYVKELLLNV